MVGVALRGWLLPADGGWVSGAGLLLFVCLFVVSSRSGIYLRKGLSQQRNYFALLGIFHFVISWGKITRMENLAPSCSSRVGGKGLEIAVSNGRFDPKLQPPENRLQSPPSHRHRRPPEWPRKFREKLGVDKRPRPSRRADWFGLKMPAELPIDVERRASFLIFTL